MINKLLNAAEGLLTVRTLLSLDGSKEQLCLLGWSATAAGRLAFLGHENTDDKEQG